MCLFIVFIVITVLVKNKGVASMSGESVGLPPSFGNTDTMLGGTSLAAAKLAPDGKVYWATYNSDYLGVVNQPDAPGAAADFVAQGLSLNGCKSGFGLPNQTASYLEYLPPIPR